MIHKTQLCDMTHWCKIQLKDFHEFFKEHVLEEPKSYYQVEILKSQLATQFTM